MNIRLFLYGLGIWVWATIGLRLGGQYLLQAGDWKRTLVVFAVSFPIDGLDRTPSVQPVPSAARRMGRRRHRASAADALPRPVLEHVLPDVFPNMAPEAAGAFGGWMLWCCAGALVGVTVHR